MIRRTVTTISLLGLLLAPGFALAQQKKEQPQPQQTAPVNQDKAAPYDQQLIRLAEILGSVHYLRTLCGARAVTGAPRCKSFSTRKRQTSLHDGSA